MLLLQGIERIEGLGACRSLEKLWVIENKLTHIDNIGHLTGLKELYLHSNRITDISNLEQLVHLEVRTAQAVQPSTHSLLYDRQHCQHLQPVTSLVSIAGAVGFRQLHHCHSGHQAA